MCVCGCGGLDGIIFFSLSWILRFNITLLILSAETNTFEIQVEMTGLDSRGES